MPEDVGDARPLSTFTPGDEVEILALVPDAEESSETLRRLGALGFIRGTRVKILRRAPLGDPVEYGLRGTRVSLRRSEAAHVRVRPASGGR